MDNNIYDNFIISDCERDEISSKLSDEIIITNIRDQLDSPILLNSIDNNILKYFDERYDYIIKTYADDKTLIDNCKEIRKGIYTEICNKIIERYSITTSLLDNTDNEDFYFYVRELYRFFIINYKDNLVNFFKSYIISNRKELIKNYKTSSDKKDLTFKSLKLLFKNNDNIFIVYSYENIIQDFIEVNEDFEIVFKTLIETDPYELTFHSIEELIIDNKFDTYINGPKFLKEFFKPILNINTKEEILSPIRTDLITELANK